MKKQSKYPLAKFKWHYCVIIGVANIIDGLTMLLTLGWFATGFTL